jgi:uncharacterized repeat protein (TIGR03803 family)
MKKLLLFLAILIVLVANSSAQFTKLYEFDTITNVAYPQGSLLRIGNYFYGMACGDNLINHGAIYRIETDGSNYLKLHDFDSINGRNALNCTLISDGTYLYGVTPLGGTSDQGTIFKMKLDGTAFTKLYDFDGSINGGVPEGALVFDGGFLYGLTLGDGIVNTGTIFKIKPDGTSYTKLHDFNVVANGVHPTGSLILEGSFFYGMTNSGGINNAGTIFKIMLDGTGYTKLFDFDDLITGGHPGANLVADGTFLYGVTSYGGVTGVDGTLFKIKYDGTGYIKLLDFDNILKGRTPLCNLIIDGGFLYGLTVAGGLADYGTVFKIKSDGSSFTKLLDFDGILKGRTPSYCSLIMEFGFLYGVAGGGGTSDLGTIFKLSPFGALGISQNATQEKNILNLYPNPSTGIFNLTTTSVGQLSVYNALGKMVLLKEIKQLNSNGETIDLSGQANGMYLLQLTTEKGSTTEKIILDK